MKIFKMIGKFFLYMEQKFKNHAKCDISCQTLVPDLNKIAQRLPVLIHFGLPVRAICEDQIMPTKKSVMHWR